MELSLSGTFAPRNFCTWERKFLLPLPLYLPLLSLLATPFNIKAIYVDTA